MILHIRRCKVGVPGKSPMSAYGYKQTSRGLGQNVRFTPESGHRRRRNASDSKSGHPMSALTPKADIGEGIPECPLMTQSGHCLNQSCQSFLSHISPDWVPNPLASARAPDPDSSSESTSVPWCSNGVFQAIEHF